MLRQYWKITHWGLFAVLAGCGFSVSHPPTEAMIDSASQREILETTQEDVKNCRLLGIVENSSILGSGYGLAGLSAARETAIDRARILGATHIVWLDVIQGGKVTSSDAGLNETIVVNGAAYYCKNKQVSFELPEEKKKEEFNYSEEQLKKKDRMKLVDDTQDSDAAGILDEKVDSKALQSLPETTFSPGEGSLPTLGEKINIDNGTNPFVP